jgi:hypothetical protein
MAHAIVDAELSEPLPDIALGAEEDGLAVLLRSAGRPAYFALYPLPPGARMSGDELWELVRHEAAPDLLGLAIRDAIAQPPSRPVAAADVTVAICTRDRTALLRECLDSLLALGPRAPAVLVVDNDPPDGATRALVSSLDCVDYACEPRPGLDFARNRALREAPAPSSPSSTTT